MAEARIPPDPTRIPHDDRGRSRIHRGRVSARHGLRPRCFGGGAGCPTPGALGPDPAWCWRQPHRARSSPNAAEQGGDADSIAEAAGSVASACGNVFVVGALELANAGGRLAVDRTTGEGGIPVLSLIHGRMEVVTRCAEAQEAAAVMGDHILGAGERLRVGVGASDVSSFAVADALVSRLNG